MSFSGMCIRVVADTADDVSSIQVNRVRLKIALTELIIKEDTSGNSSFAEFLWRSIITEFVRTGDTKEVTLREETVLVKVLMPFEFDASFFGASVIFHLRKVSVVEQVSISWSPLHTDIKSDDGDNLTSQHLLQ